MTLKKWLDDNPLKAALGIAISSAGAATGVTTYFYDQSLERQTREGALFNEELKSRLAGIERRVGPQDRSYFDISRLIIPSSSISSLGTDFQNLGDGGVFVDVPADGGWAYALVSEQQAAGMVASEEEAATAMGAIPIAQERNVHLWRRNEAIRVPTNLGSDLTYFPLVAVQVLDNDRLAGAIANFVAQAGEPTRGVNELESTLGEIQSAQRRPADGANVAQAAQLDRELSNLFRGNIALIMLSGVLRTSVDLARMIPNAQVDLRNVEKRGNVLYAQSSMRISGAEGSAPGAGPAVIDSEWFIVTMPRRTVFIRTLIPSRDGRSEAFQWVTRFLAGIRIPLEQA